MKIVYIAGPYQGKTHGGRSYMQIEEHIRMAEKYAIMLWDAGFGVFCPHLNTAHFELKSKAPTQAYVEADIRMLEVCDILFLLPGWENSKGTKQEIERAKELALPIYKDIQLLIVMEEDEAISNRCRL